MEILNKIDSILNIILIIAFIVSILIMKKIKSQSSNQDKLNKNEKIIVWATCLLAPFFAGLVYYFGWKKLLPQKAKEANNISWSAMLILAFFWFTLSALVNK
ncbi:MAG: hypothetical protein ABH818_03210 [Patescibacteria group bacterium]